MPSKVFADNRGTGPLNESPFQCITAVERICLACLIMLLSTRMEKFQWLDHFMKNETCHHELFVLQFVLQVR